MKKYFTIVLLFLLSAQWGFSQIQATLKAGSKTNSVYVTFRPQTTITVGKFSSFQFAIGIPAALAEGITASVVSLDPLMNYATQTSTETQGGTSFTVFGFSGDGAQSGPGTTYTAGTEYNYAEVFFTSPQVITLTAARLMQLPNGGTTGNVNLYVFNDISDVTHPTAPFYSAVPLNANNDGNGYAGNSFVSYGPLVLPVKFLGFNVTKKNNDAVLNWQVENETDITDRYEVERSVDGSFFKKVGTVAPKNNGRGSNSYELTDLNLHQVANGPVFFYRVRQTDKDGKFVFSAIQRLRIDRNGLQISLYPNPVKATTNLNIDMEQDGDAIITINDASGKQLQHIQYQLFKGQNIKNLNLSKLTSGSYLLKIQTGKEIKTLSVVKTN